MKSKKINSRKITKKEYLFLIRKIKTQAKMLEMLTREVDKLVEISHYERS